MKFTTPNISWHDREPIFAIDFHISGKIATGGADKIVNIWKIEEDQSITYLSSLIRHTKAVNAVKFSPDGQYLATSGDDGFVYIWKLDPTKKHVAAFGDLAQELPEMKEIWSVVNTLSKGGKDIYALDWSSDSTQVLTGSIDNNVNLWYLQRQQGIRHREIHDHFNNVQGVCFDPQNVMFVTQSADRTVRVYQRTTKGRKIYCAHLLKNRRAEVLQSSSSNHPSKVEAQTEAAQMQIDSNDNHQISSHQVTPPHTDSDSNNVKEYFTHKMWLDENLPSFFRRPCFSPEGNFLFVPSGIFLDSPDSHAKYATYVFTRKDCGKPIAYYISSEPSIIVKCCPILFKPSFFKSQTQLKTSDKMDLDTAANVSIADSSAQPLDSSDSKKIDVRVGASHLFDIDYKLVFAISTTETVLIYDTEHEHPIVLFKDAHYDSITDLCWSPDGLTLAVCSTDGYVSLINFNEGELGVRLNQEDYDRIMKASIGARVPAPPEVRKPRKTSVVNQTSDATGEMMDTEDNNNQREEEEDDEDEDLDEEEATLELAGKKVIDLDGDDGEDHDNLDKKSSNSPPTSIMSPVMKRTATRRIAPTLLSSTSTNENQPKP